MRAAAAVGKTAVSSSRPHSPVSPAEQSAPPGRRVSGDGVLRAKCTKCTGQTVRRPTLRYRHTLDW